MVDNVETIIRTGEGWELNLEGFIIPASYLQPEQSGNSMFDRPSAQQGETFRYYISKLQSTLLFGVTQTPNAMRFSTGIHKIDQIISENSRNGRHPILPDMESYALLALANIQDSEVASAILTEGLTLASRSQKI